ncbi:MAG TPA: cysteine desulfurase CsdA [Algoriphagus sp.]|mgnify:CR=1 FL=1|jgi:cysteine desulfurase/selenocysteine lyase|uniref:cysteine desulfurase n=1 Tax=unclassified Algoriphagus TaxID=2641541 RepID=UPI000C4E2F63|nr:MULTISPECIES: cysteine desulfurase [unclassified Algoriphagus]MAL14092.1 cysteine desulfurase CsdA [Algoriphagus sp.]QYH37923.1 cysteine desulfurase [Algoriphagus sp. NBT04N3]HAD53537.1 cysteine desulfurase CsdA [Algoriphagus sp.]HAH37237.1 cysteine desulfurase CsdA [Algoriphagus sp.]HCD89413.1 cysteine desulfurase CsdA [Algoriphagus sp.]|tara:strand:- start:10156 stop:11379 length:1224 start_codon:yes stop_codon:yes gene_type:complete
MNFDVNQIRGLFPVLHQEVHGKPLIYFDNAATTQKPKQVLEALTSYYEKDNSNIHRGAHALADRATQYFENTRESVRKFINAKESAEIIFTKGTTESINLIAQTFGRKFIGKGDEIIISTMEHHSNIVPWQMLCEATGAVLKIIPIHENGELDYQEFEKLLTSKTKLLSVVHASNALGTINPVKKMIDAAHAVGAKVLLDGAQSTSHLEIDVVDLDCDFMVFSAHKLYGPTGLGVLYGNREILEAMPPFLGGGEMIKEVTFEKTTYNDIPFKFEAGTPNIADVIAFDAAIEFIDSLGKKAIKEHEDELLSYANELTADIKGFQPIGTAKQKVSVLSFNINGMHPFDVGQMLDARGIAVRTGHHCTQPLMKRFGIEGTVRASFAVYNTKSEIEQMAEGIARIAKIKNK